MALAGPVASVVAESAEERKACPQRVWPGAAGRGEKAGWAASRRSSVASTIAAAEASTCIAPSNVDVARPGTRSSSANGVLARPGPNSGRATSR